MVPKAVVVFEAVMSPRVLLLFEAMWLIPGVVLVYIVGCA